jgi:hypothetical protein
MDIVFVENRANVTTLTMVYCLCMLHSLLHDARRTAAVTEIALHFCSDYVWY